MKIPGKKQVSYKKVYDKFIEGLDRCGMIQKMYTKGKGKVQKYRKCKGKAKEMYGKSSRKAPGIIQDCNR